MPPEAIEIHGKQVGMMPSLSLSLVYSAFCPCQAYSLAEYPLTGRLLEHILKTTISVLQPDSSRPLYQISQRSWFWETIFQIGVFIIDWSSFKFIDLFAGIGGIRLGFESVGGKCVFSSEWDADACKTYEANFGERPAGDITKIDAMDIPDFDILLGGFPCQAFSIIGKREGFADETRGTLFFEIERILRDRRPPAFMLENVRNLTAHDNGRTFRVIVEHLDALGYDVFAKVLNALDYGVPQNRERIIIVGFRSDLGITDFEFPAPIPVEERKTLSDILETNVPDRYYVRPEIRESRLKRLKDKDYPKPYISHENIGRTSTPHPYCSALRAGASANYILINDERRPTERELLRIQGFPDSYKIVCSYTAVRKQTGNSVAVPVIKAVAKEMLRKLRN